MIAEVAAAIAASVENVAGLVEAAPSPLDKVNPPAFHLSLTRIDYGLSINDNGEKCSWLAGVVVSRTALAAQYAKLEVLLDPKGTAATSIVAALRADETFGGTCDGSSVGAVASVNSVEGVDGTAYILATVEVATWT